MSMHTPNQHVIIRYGGSLLVPDHLDLELLGRFGDMLRKHIARGVSFVVLVSGKHRSDGQRGRRAAYRDGG